MTRRISDDLFPDSIQPQQKDTVAGMIVSKKEEKGKRIFWERAAQQTEIHSSQHCTHFTVKSQKYKPILDYTFIDWDRFIKNQHSPFPP